MSNTDIFRADGQKSQLGVEERLKYCINGQKSQKGVKKTLKPLANGQKSQKGVDFQINFTPFSSFWPKPAYKAEKSTPFSSFWPPEHKILAKPQQTPTKSQSN